MNKSTVSVCIPSYNHSQYIKDNLLAIFNQTHQPLELIVIDDGSSDGSPEIIRQLLLECPFEAKLIVRENRGLPTTINQALEMASGEFFATIASDDIWLPDFLKHRVSQLQNRPEAVLAYGHCYIIDDENNIVGNTSNWYEYEDGDVRNMLLTKYPPSSPTVLYRKSALDIHKWNPKAFVEDYDIYLRLSAIGDFAFEPTALSAYRVHKNNISKNISSMTNSVVAVIESNAELLQITKEERKLIEDNIRWSTIESYLSAGNRIKAIKEAIILCINSNHSPSDKTKMLLKLIVPYKFIESRRKKIYKEKHRNIKELLIGSNLN